MIVSHSPAKTYKGAERLLRFLTRRIREMREGGLPVLVRKVTTILMMAPAAVVLLVACMARPLVLIRFGRLFAATLGPLALRRELYLCQRVRQAMRPPVFINTRNALNQEAMACSGFEYLGVGRGPRPRG